MIPVDTTNAEKMPRLLKELGKPFEPGCVGWKPGSVAKTGNKAMALAYIDSRDVMDRLDSLVMMGLLDGWKDEYEPLQNGAVRCRLYLCINGQWVPREDVGGASAQPDAGDKVKAAFSDALKRAAVKWGIGRYLYHLDAAWCDYDPQRKKFARDPQLPAWALPGGTGRPPTYSLPPHLAAEQHHDDPAPASATKNGPLPGPATAPKDNAAVRAKRAQELAQAKSRPDYLRTCQCIADDVKNGVLSAADRDWLAPLARETGARFPAEQAAK